MTNCSAYAAAFTIADGQSSTTTNTAAGYTGSATATCSNGTWVQGNPPKLR
jgi:hypothetical protein